MTRFTRALQVGVVAMAVALAACGGRGDQADPGPAPPPPNLAGQRVMLLPVQVPAPERLDAELAYWLADALPTVEWLLPDELQAVADRTPAWRLRLATTERPVVDTGGNDRRIVDPMYGALRQLGAVINADYALVPVAVAERLDSAGIQLAMTVAVVDIRGGRVLWLHTVTGNRNPLRGPAVASVAEAVARSLLP